MSIPSYFNDVLAKIRLSPIQISDLKSGHTTLRSRLNADDDLSKIIVSTFLQGSYRRSTAVKPRNGKRADVDIIVVTNLDRNEISPQEAIDRFIPFVEKHYKGKYEIQGRSIGIELSYVDLDIVVTSAPSESAQQQLRAGSVVTNLMLEDDMTWKLVSSWVEPDQRYKQSFAALEAIKRDADWKLEPLWIPDRDADEWVETHPLEQIRWTRDKNKATNNHYVNVVKALKWWRILKVTDLKYPKGYPVEHLIGDCCPDGVTSVAEGIVKTLEGIVDKYQVHYNLNIKPVLPDRGVPAHDVWKRITVEDFKKFFDYVKGAAETARKALDASTVSDKVKYWKELFGSAFPDAPDGDSKSNNNLSGPAGGFTARQGGTEPSGGRFA